MNNDPNKEWVMEQKDGEEFEQGSDPFLAKSRAKKEAMQVRRRCPCPCPPLSLSLSSSHPSAETRQT
jgi:hypothetical protein